MSTNIYKRIVIKCLFNKKMKKAVLATTHDRAHCAWLQMVAKPAHGAQFDNKCSDILTGPDLNSFEYL